MRKARMVAAAAAAVAGSTVSPVGPTPVHAAVHSCTWYYATNTYVLPNLLGVKGICQGTGQWQVFVTCASGNKVGGWVSSGEAQVWCGPNEARIGGGGISGK